MKLSDRFSLGAGVSYQRLKATLSQSVAYGGITLGAASQVAAATGNPAVIPGMLAQIGGVSGLALEGVSQVEGDTWSWGWNAGAAVQIGKEGHLAASYRSRIEHDVAGDVTFGGAPVFTTAGPLGGLGTALNGRFANGPVTTRIELPETVSVGASYEGARFEVLGDWTWTGWSSIQDLRSTRGRLGPEQRASQLRGHVARGISASTMRSARRGRCGWAPPSTRRPWRTGIGRRGFPSRTARGPRWALSGSSASPAPSTSATPTSS